MPSPDISDYPPLQEWLLKHDAQCLWYVSDWEGARRNPLRHVEGWIVRGSLVLVVLQPEKRGWNIYTALDSIDIPTTLADVEARIGLAPDFAKVGTNRAMEITDETTIGQLAVELAKNGVQICQLSTMPDGNRRCDLADHAWARGHGEGATAADAIDNALVSLREQLAILAGADPNNPVSLDE